MTTKLTVAQIGVTNFGTLNAYHVTPYRHTFNILGTKANLYRAERFFDEGTTLQIQHTGVPGVKEPKVPVAVGGV